MEYKGFDIEFSKKNNRFYFGEWVQGAGFLDSDGCSEAGYATESAAKVAITKYLKQQEQMQAHQEFISRAEEGLRNENVVEALPVLKKIMQQRNITVVQQSRNKREGFFSGLYNGSVKRLPIDTYHDGVKYVWSNSDKPKNRKQRKAAKLHEKICQQELNNVVNSLQKGCIYDYQ